MVIETFFKKKSIFFDNMKHSLTLTLTHSWTHSLSIIFVNYSLSVIIVTSTVIIKYHRNFPNFYIDIFIFSIFVFIIFFFA